MRIIAPIWSAWRAAGGRVAAALAVTFLALAIGSSAAFAATDAFFQTGILTHGFGYASPGIHSINYIQGTGVIGGFCSAKDSGSPGVDFATRTVSGARTCATSGRFAARVENGFCCYRGWIDNDNIWDETIDPVATYYSY
jgi:hypothetical protein